MTQIPFTVSARAAMLIGRENIANAKGAVIELVKNCYDADSSFCIIFVDNEFSELPLTLSFNQIKKIEAYCTAASGFNYKWYLKKLYKYNGDIHYLKENACDLYKAAFLNHLQKLSCIYIIDAGEGMTADTIKKHWMTIGTDNKLNDYFTNSKRVKSGAKGIGRFALDKLGAQCRMTTLADLSKHGAANQIKTNGSVWEVDWSDFEAQNRIISDVKASLESVNYKCLQTAVLDSVRGFDLHKIISELNKRNKDNQTTSISNDPFLHGTVLKISNLHDKWDDKLVKKVYSDLEVLVPPRDIEEFRIFLLSSLNFDSYGEINSSICDDFDYKLTAIADDKQNVHVSIFREEYDAQTIPDEFFDRPNIKNSSQAKKDVFVGKVWTKSYTFSQLLSGFSDRDNNNIFSKIGPFEFSFYYLKKGTTTADTDRFHYKKFRAHERKSWLDRFGGIKLFRDNFRVRPYGEVNEPAFDWLSLGARKASSPAGIAKQEGGYKVEPENIAGSIKISRLTNLEFEDKSSRDGLQESPTFSVFKKLIISIIGIFEEDRAFIAKELAAYDNDKNSNARNLKMAEDLAKAILERERQRKDQAEKQSQNTNGNESNSFSDSPENSKEIALAHLVESLKENNEKLVDEQKLLRGLASSGIVSASFGHDLSKIRGKLGERVDDLIDLLSPKVAALDFELSPDYKNPFIFLETMRKQDMNIHTWLGFSLGFTRKDKRKRRQIYLFQYFEALKVNWFNALYERGIDLEINCSDDIKIKAFEIDFDSIFINLLVNSIDAFLISKKTEARRITITCKSESDQIAIEYKDTGPGLSKDIDDPEKIFKPLFTTKRDEIGTEMGTGLGMWLVKSITEEYEGQTRLLFTGTGFGIRILFPFKLKK